MRSARSSGTVVECGIYVSETAANRDFNMLLVAKQPDAASGDPNPERFKKFQAELRAQLEEAKEDKLVEGYEELRTFFGEQNFRRVEFK